MLNCSSQDDYLAFTLKVAAALRKRGYPSEDLQLPQYDEHRREQTLARLQTRMNHGVKRTIDALVFKCTYTSLQRGLRIRAEITNLLRRISDEVGVRIDPKIVVANRVSGNLYLRTHGLNFAET